MKFISKILVVAIIGIFISSCSSSNPYMTKSTDEYQTVTNKLLGEWGVTGYKVDGKEMLHNKYSKMKADFDFLGRTVQFDIWVADGTISDKLLDWKEKFPGIKVDEYKISYTAGWYVTEDGKNLVLTNPNTDLVIKGDGENFTGFYNWEKSKFNAAKSMDDGSLLGSALGSLAKSATGTSDLFPEISDSYKIVNIKDNFVLLRNGQNSLRLVR